MKLWEGGACASGSVENIVYPLHHAVDCDYVDCIYLLIQNGADVNAPDESNHTPLLLSASKGSYETMEALIQNGAHVNYCDTNDPEIPESVIA
jgi:ankyrin repeat protein